MTKVLFYEPDANGHHFPYLARMLPGFFGQGYELLLATTPEALSSEQFQRFLAPLESHFQTVEAQPKIKSSSFRIAKQRVADIRRLHKTHTPDHTFVAYADGLWQIMAFQALLGRSRPTGPGTLEGIVYRGGFTYPTATSFTQKVKRFLFRRLCSKGIFDRLLLDDEYLYDFAKTLKGRSKTRLELAVNPVTFFSIDGDAARQRLGLTSSNQIISLSGMIDPRKGADRLIEAFTHVATQGLTDAVLLLAGPHSDAIKDILSEPLVKPLCEANRIISLDQLLDEQDMYSVAAASDLVTAPYPNHMGRSSILLWAAAAGRPVLGVDRGCIARIIEQEQLGWTCDVHDQQAFRDAMVTALQSPWAEEDQQRAVTYSSWHSIDHYRTLNSAFVRQRYGEKPTRSTR